MAAGLDTYRIGLAGLLEAEANIIYQLVRYDLDRSHWQRYVGEWYEGAIFWNS